MNQRNSNQKPLNLSGIFGFSISLASGLALLFIFFLAESYWLKLVILALPLVGTMLSAIGFVNASKKGAGFYGFSLAGLITSVSVFLIGAIAFLLILDINGV